MSIATPRSVLITEAVKGIVARINAIEQVAKALVDGVKLTDRSTPNGPSVEITAAEIRAAISAQDLAEIDALVAFYKAQ